MAQFPRKTLSREDPPEDWIPPAYASSEEDNPEDPQEITLKPNPKWKSPSYATPAETPKDEKKIGFLESVKNAVDFTKKEFKGSKIDRYLEGAAAVPKSMFESIKQAGKQGAEQIRSGDIHGAFETVTNPLMGPMNIVNKKLEDVAYGRKVEQPNKEDARHQVISQVADVLGLPWDEAVKAYKEGDYSKLAGMGTSAIAMAVAPHGFNKAKTSLFGPRADAVPPKLQSKEVPYRMGSSDQREVRTQLGEKSPLQSAADKIIERMTPVPEEPVVKEPAIQPDRTELQKKADAIVQQIQEEQDRAAGIRRPKALLPERTSPRFIAGEAGIADATKNYDMLSGDPNPMISSGTETLKDIGQTVRMPPHLVAEGSTPTGRPLPAGEGKPDIVKAQEDILNPPEQPKKPFVNPFEKPKSDAPLTDESGNVIDESGRIIAPKQTELAVETPLKAPGTEFAEQVTNTPKAKVIPDEPIKRDILRDYTGKDYDKMEYEKARNALKMGQDQPVKADVIEPKAGKEKSPFPVADEAIMEEVLRNKQVDYNNPRLEDIPLAGLKGTQSTFDPNTVSDYQGRGDRPRLTEVPQSAKGRMDDQSPVVIRIGDQNILAGGHHRAIADLNNKKGSIQAVVYDAKVSPELLERFKASSEAKPEGWKAPDYAQSTETVQAEAPAKKTNPATAKFQTIVDEFNANNAPDLAYRSIPLGDKGVLKKGETWKSRVENAINEINKKSEGDDRLFPKQMRATEIPENVALGGASERGLDILGTTLYSENRPLIAAKELLQNAVDEHRIAGVKGPIRFLFDNSDPIPNSQGKGLPEGHPADGRSLTILDQGRGVKKEQIYTVLTNMFESGKADEAGASGGFGIAKAAPMMGGKYAYFESTVVENGKKVKYTFGGTPAELKNQKIGVPINREVLDSKAPTGLKVKVWYDDSSYTSSAAEKVKAMAEHSMNNESPIEIATGYGISEASANDFFAGKEQSKYSSIYADRVEKLKALPTPEIQDTIKIPGADIDVHYNTPTHADKAQKAKIRVANMGLHQFDFSKNYSYQGAIRGVPSEIKFNVKPTVAEGVEGYPFTANREQLQTDTLDAVNEWIEKNIISGAREKQKQSLLDMFKGMKPIATGNKGVMRETVLYDPNNILTPEQHKAFTENPFIKEFTNFVDEIVHHALESGGPSWGNKIKKVGITLDPTVHGIWIPHPEDRSTAAILINPFINISRHKPIEAARENIATMWHEAAHTGEYSESQGNIDWSNADMSDPEAASFYQKYINEVQHANVVGDAGHGLDFLRHTAEVYSKAGTGAWTNSVRRLHDLFTDNDRFEGYTPEIQKALLIYKERERIAGTERDILSGTGVSADATRGGKDSIPPNGGSDGGGASSAVNKLFSALEDARSRVDEQEAINREERASRFSAFGKVKGTGAKAAARSLSKLRGEFEKADPGERLGLNQKETDALFTAVKHANITLGEKARGYTALFKLLNGETNPVRSELAILDDVFGNGFGQKIIEMHGGIGAVGLQASKIASTMKSMMSSVDVSAPLRQGAGLVTRKEFIPAFVEMFKYLAKPEYHQQAMEQIMERPNYLLGKDAGLFISKPGGILSTEEAFLNSYTGHIPVVKQIVGASDRAYSGFLNKLRADTFDNMIQKAKDLGYNVGDAEGGATKEAKAIAKFINTTTGRGDLGRLNRVTNELNMVLWSPKLLASRIEMIANPKIYTNLPKGMRREGLRSLLGIASMGLMTSGLAMAAGGDVSTNILSSDFMKARFGDKVLDPWAGYQQYVVAAARFLAGKTDSPRPTDRASIAGRFLANKESPAASLAHSLLTAKKFTGDRNNPKTAGNFINAYGENTSVQREVADRFIPMTIQTLTELMESDPKWSDEIGLKAAMTGLSAVGMGVQSYPKRKLNELKIGKPRLR